MENLKKNIDLDLDELLDKHYYQKKEKELRDKNEEEKGTLPRIDHRKNKRGKALMKDRSVSEKKISFKTKNNDNSSNDSGKARKNNVSNTHKDKPLSPIKKGKANALDQRGKKMVKKQNTIDCTIIYEIVLEIYGRCKENLENGSPVPDQLIKYFEDVEKKFCKLKS